MGLLWFAVGMFFAGVAYWLASGRGNTAKVWAEIAGLDPIFGPFAIVAILFTRKTDA